MSSFCDLKKQHLLRFQGVFSFLTKTTLWFFRCSSAASSEVSSLAYHCPNINNFDADFYSERRCEEVIR